MIDLISSTTGKVPKKRTTTVRATFKPRAPEARPMTAAESRKELFRKVDGMRTDLQDGLKGFHNRYTDLAYDLKESARQREFVRKVIADFGARLAVLEKIVNRDGGSAPRPAESVLRRTAETDNGPKLPILDPLSAWQEKVDAAVKRLQELPPVCTPNELAAHFAVPYEVIQKLWLRGRLRIARNGTRKHCHITISREAIAAYVSNYGVPCLKHRGGTR